MEISKEKGERLCLNGAIQFKGFFFILCMFICFNILIMVRVFTNIMNHMRACKLVLLITLLLIDCHNILLGSILPVEYLNSFLTNLQLLSIKLSSFHCYH